ncbi:MAG TPA: restriction endonuclease subunit S [Pyrinomonadaceae bacterium]
MTEQTQSPFLPDGWVEVTLGEVLPIQYGKGLPENARDSNGKVPVYGSNGIVGWHSEALTESATLIIGRKGGAGQVHYSPVPCWVIDTAYYVEAATNDYINLRYFSYLLQTIGLEQLDKSTAIPSLSRDDYNKLKAPLAPLAEQQRIVDEIEKQLSRLDTGTEILRRINRSLERVREVTLSTAVAGKLVPTEAELARNHGRDYESADVLLKRILHDRRTMWEESELAKMQEQGRMPRNDAWKAKYDEPAGPDTRMLTKLPEGWTWASVEQLGALGEQTVLTGPFGTALGTRDFQASGVPVITIGCLTERGINLDKALYVSPEKAASLKRYRLEHGDLLFSRMATVGRAGVVDTSIVGALINYHIMRLRLSKDVLLPGFYLAYVRGAKTVYDYVRKVNHGATRDGINTEQLLAMPVSVPPFAEQQRIVQELERRVSVIEELKDIVITTLRRAASLRKNILQQAFLGRLVPQDDGEEPAVQLLEKIGAERLQYESERKRRYKERNKKLMPKAKETAIERRNLVEFLKELPGRIKPEELFTRSGYKPDEVEEFYADLKIAELAGAFSEEKQDDGSVYLRAHR